VTAMGRKSPPPDLWETCPRTARAWERAEDGHVVLLVPKFDGAILGRFLQPRLRNPWMRIHLDALGSAVWQRCDGSRTGARIAEEMAGCFPEVPSLPDRVRRFLRLLQSQGHVA